MPELLKILCNSDIDDSLVVQEVAVFHYAIKLKERDQITSIMLSKKTALALIEVLLDLKWSK